MQIIKKFNFETLHMFRHGIVCVIFGSHEDTVFKIMRPLNIETSVILPYMNDITMERLICSRIYYNAYILCQNINDIPSKQLCSIDIWFIQWNFLDDKQKHDI